MKEEREPHRRPTLMKSTMMDDAVSLACDGRDLSQNSNATSANVIGS